MGKTKLLTEVRRVLERTITTTHADGKHALHLFYGVADIANKSQKLHPWRRIVHDLFAVDLHKGVQAGTGAAKGLPQVRARGASAHGCTRGGCTAARAGARTTPGPSLPPTAVAVGPTDPAGPPPSPPC